MTEKRLRVLAFLWWHCTFFFSSTVLKANARSTFSSHNSLCRSAFAAMPGSPPQETPSRFSENGGESSSGSSKGSLRKNVPPNELLHTIGFQNGVDADISDTTTTTPLWNLFLPQRLSSPVALGGTWIASNGDHPNSIDSISHVETGSKPGSGKIQLFCRDSSDENAVAAAMEVAKASIDYLFDLKTKSTPTTTSSSDENNAIRKSNVLLQVTFSALDRKLWEKLQSILRNHYQVKSSWEYPCGMWVYQQPQDDMEQSSPTTTLEEENRLPPNAVLRPLSIQDAELVDSRWEYRCAKSINMIQEMLTASETTHGGSYGLEVDGILVAWVCRYLDGTIGMLWTEEEHRRKGYGAMVVHAAVQSLVQRQRRNNKSGDIAIPPVISFTVDTNDASRGLLARMNWQRVQDADWVGFTLVI